MLAVVASFMLLTGSTLAAPAVERVPVLIAFSQQPGPPEEALVRGAGGVIKYTYHLVPAIAATVPQTSIEGLLHNPNVTAIDPDGEVHAIDGELDNAWGVKRIGAGTVHDGGNKGSGVKVAVIDSGIDHTHPDLDANFVGGHDFVNNDTDPMDDFGHGTHVAGTIAAEDNNVGVVGVAPEASLYGLKVLNSSGGGSWSDIIAALQWAVDNSIQVTNNSYGSSINPGGTVQAAFENSAAAGVLHVAAAGNSGNPKGKGNNVGYPARFGSVIAVAATDQNDNRASFSSTGDAVELAAPGVAVNSTVPMPPDDGDGCGLCDDSGYKLLNGTSMASPHAAGTAALAIAAGIADVRTQLRTTADDLGDSGWDPQYGFGLVDADEAAAAVSPTPTPLAITTASLPDGTVNEAYSATLEATGGTPPYSWAITVGVLPDGLSLNSATGEISGTPATEGTKTFTVTVTDDSAATDSQQLSITIAAAPTEASAVSVDSITYATEGGKNKDKHLLITVALVDDLSNPVGGASVSITVTRDSVESRSGTGTTGADGTVTFSWKNAKSGCYTETGSVSAQGLTWDEIWPDSLPIDPFCK